MPKVSQTAKCPYNPHKLQTLIKQGQLGATAVYQRLENAQEPIYKAHFSLFDLRNDKPKKVFSSNPLINSFAWTHDYFHPLCLQSGRNYVEEALLSGIRGACISLLNKYDFKVVHPEKGLVTAADIPLANTLQLFGYKELAGATWLNLTLDATKTGNLTRQVNTQNLLRKMFLSFKDVNELTNLEKPWRYEHQWNGTEVQTINNFGIAKQMRVFEIARPNSV
ncbi:MAG: hypothetical protein VKJ06_07100 [Vampirovibrionales bacterium]|nr:hypothetical protein [Vampirovibrionales bacterium]